MESVEGEQHGPVVEADRVLATYQHVRERWGLKNADTARMKAKRAGWPQLPKNSPSETTRLVVPREHWDAVGERSRGMHLASLGERRWGTSAGTGPRAAEILALPDLTARIAAVLGKIEERDAVELRKAQTELAELRERAARAEAERDQARAERERVEQQAAQVQAELDSWTAGGPLARAVRAFLYRRR